MHVYSGKRTVKSCVVEVLAKKFPLTIKELRSNLSSIGLSVSYQAVHKETLKLQSEGVVVREEDTYALNQDWIKRCALHFNEMKEDYCGNHSHPRVLILRARKNPCMLEFSSLIELDEYIIEMLKHTKGLDGNLPIIIQSKHRRWPLLYPKKEKEMLKKIEVHTTYGSSSHLDRFAARMERSFGMDVTHKKGVGEQWELIVIGDLVLQVYINHGIAERIHSLYTGCYDLKTYLLENLLELAITETTHTVLVQNNPLLAEKLRGNRKKEVMITLNDY